MSTNASNRYAKIIDALPPGGRSGAASLRLIEESGLHFWVPYCKEALFLVSAHEETQFVVATSRSELEERVASWGHDREVDFREVDGETLVGLAHYLWRTRQITDLDIIDWDPKR